MTAIPTISVVLPVYNGERFIVEAVTSILTQTFGDFELLVIDDGSTDNTRGLLLPLARGDARLIIHAEARRGLVGALNFGIGQSCGRYIARMDADDVALPERFAAQVDYLDKHPDCVAVGTSIIKFDATGREKASGVPRVQAFEPSAFPPVIPGIAHPTAMIRAEALRRVDSYRPYFYNTEDRDLWARLWQIGRLHQLPQPLLRYRVHAGSVSRQKRVDQLISHMMADMSALCRHLGLDDQPILDRSLTMADRQHALDAYAALIGDRYPVDMYRRYHCIRNRMWRQAPFASRSEMMLKVAACAARRPFDRASLKLLATAVRHGPATQRTEASS
jgi:glycosyltransferase involved in cell wall biosynthesis